MSSLKEKIASDFKKALKANLATEVSALRMLKAAILNKEKERPVQKSKLTDDEILNIILSEIKKRKEALEIYEKAGRKELALKEKQELEVLQRYLPPQLSDQELLEIVVKAIQETGATSQKDIGKVMSKVMGQVKGRVDGSKVLEVVKSTLK